MKFDPVPILIVDDLEENLIALEALLRSDDIQVLKATTGSEALELLLDHEVALALIDVQMPDMDGFELAALMHGNLRTKGIPIIFLTAGDSDDQRHYKGYEAGAVDFLQKPINPDILKSKAGVFFELHRRHQECARQRDELEVASQEARRHAEELKELDRRKDEFLAMLAHELRTPLTPIRNGLEILCRQQSNSDNANRVCEMMSRQLSHLVHLVDDLLDMSRVTKGKITLRKQKTELQSVIRSAVESVKPAVDHAGHELRVNTDDAPIWVDADFTRLDQVVNNLLNNAVKYTPNGGTIVLSAYVENNEAVVCVTDNGIGIPANMLTKIFDLFTQLNVNIAPSQGGLGIGLALVKQLVAMHGGSIRVESQGQDKGSSFTVRLPVTTPPEESSAGTSKEVMPKSKSLKILVVDDNVDSARTTGWLLESMGYSDYALAHDGPEAIEAAKKLKPHAILLDIGLPGMNGYEVCRELRRNPQFANTLIVAQTGWGQDRDREMAYFAGFDQHFTKPLKPDDISSLFAKIVP